LQSAPPPSLCCISLGSMAHFRCMRPVVDRPRCTIVRNADFHDRRVLFMGFPPLHCNHPLAEGQIAGVRGDIGLAFAADDSISLDRDFHQLGQRFSCFRERKIEMTLSKSAIVIFSFGAGRGEVSATNVASARALLSSVADIAEAPLFASTNERTARRILHMSIPSTSATLLSSRSRGFNPSEAS
jgi:hypothetical protein